MNGKGLPYLPGAGENGLPFFWESNRRGSSLGDEGKDVNLGR